MCWSAIARPGTSPCVTADAAPTATAPIAAPMAAAIPRDIIRHLQFLLGCSRLRRLWYGHRRYNFGDAAKGLKVVAILGLEVESIVRRDFHRDRGFTQLSKNARISGIESYDVSQSRAQSESTAWRSRRGRRGGPRRS